MSFFTVGTHRWEVFCVSATHHEGRFPSCLTRHQDVGDEGEIWTHGRLPAASFQDWCNKPDSATSPYVPSVRLSSVFPLCHFERREIICLYTIDVILFSSVCPERQPSFQFANFYHLQTLLNWGFRKAFLSIKYKFYRHFGACDWSRTNLTQIKSLVYNRFTTHAYLVARVGLEPTIAVYQFTSQSNLSTMLVSKASLLDVLIQIARKAALPTWPSRHKRLKIWWIFAE